MCLSRKQKVNRFIMKRRAKNIQNFGDASVKRSGLKNSARQKAAHIRGRNGNGMFLKGTSRYEVPTYTLTLPSREGAPIFKVTKVVVRTS